jgi:hypothetical protein
MLVEKSIWLNVEKSFKDYESCGLGNAFCVGIKTNAKLHELISGTIDHIRNNKAMVFKYEIESWGRLASLQDHREELQRLWDNYGLVSAEKWLGYRRLILQDLEQTYRLGNKEHSQAIRRLFKTPIDSNDFEEQLLEDLIANTGDLPKVTYITLRINGHLFELITVFKIKLDGLGLKESDRAVLYAIDPLLYRRFRNSKPDIREIERLVMDLRMIFNTDIYYYPGLGVLLTLGVKDRWYKIDESYTPAK